MKRKAPHIMVVIYTKAGTVSAQSVRKSDNGFLDWASDVLSRGVSHIGVSHRVSKNDTESYTLTLQGGKLTKSDLCRERVKSE